jgi:glycine hydroxymethyltransferase
MGITGKDAQIALEKAGIICNKNTIPYDTQKPFVASGIRLGTPAMTTRGMKESEIKEVAALLMKGLHKRTDDAALASIREEVKSLCSKYPVYREYTH